MDNKEITKKWFQPKTSQLAVGNNPVAIYAYGIPCIDRYGGQFYYEEMFKFCRELAKEGLETYIKELFYDKILCSVKFKDNCPEYIKYAVGGIASKVFTFGQAEVDGTVCCNINIMLKSESEIEGFLSFLYINGNIVFCELLEYLQKSQIELLNKFHAKNIRQINMNDSYFCGIKANTFCIEAGESEEDSENEYFLISANHKGMRKITLLKCSYETINEYV